jgi:two-component system sensor histidine kinase ChiS
MIWHATFEKIVLRFILIFAVIISFSCRDFYSGKIQPLMQKGHLDLREWSFSEDGPVRLDGEWEFYWEKFLNSEYFTKSDTTDSPTDSKRSETVTVRVPGYWNDYTVDGKNLPGYGYATFRATVHVSPGSDRFAIKIPEIGSASVLYLNGEKVYSAGLIGDAKEHVKPQIRQKIVEIHPDSAGRLELILHVSNYDHSRGGVWYPIHFGEEDQIRNIWETKFFFDFFLIGSLLIMGLYHLGLYVLRKKDISPAIFGVLCFMFAIRSTMTGQQFALSVYPDWDYENFFKLGYSITYLLPGIMAMFLYSLFPVEYRKVPFAMAFASSLMLSITVLFTSATVYSGILLTFFMILVMVTSLYIFLVLPQAYRHGRDGAGVFMLGFFVIILTSVNDILNAEAVITTGYYAEFGFFLFIFSQAFLLSKRFSRAFSDVESLSERLLAADKMKDEFLANTSHELRTPLNGIIGIADSLIGGAAGQINDSMKKNLSLIVTSGKRLSNLINDILDFSKLNKKEIELSLKPVNVYSLADLIVAISQPLIGGKSLRIVNNISTDLSPAYADENRLQQILLNLVGNAVKFTETGEVSISGRVIPNENPNGGAKDDDVAVGDQMLEITVSDTGIGIPENKFDDIFKSFEQVDASTERIYGGTGLGLSITKHLIELHRGAIRVESKLSEGSRFIFTIPVSRQKIGADAERRLTGIRAIVEAEATADGSLSRTTSESIQTVKHAETQTVVPIGGAYSEFTILIVDDEPVNRQVLSNLLGLKNYKLIEAKNGEEALSILGDNKPDLILLDIMMPKMNGYEFCRRLREKYSMSELPVIMLTAKNQLQDLMQGMEAGANDYLPKPFSSDELLIRMQTHLQLLNFNNAIGRFVPRDFLNQIEKRSILDVRLGDQVEKEITVLFSDIRDFSSLSEKMTPKESFNFLITYLQSMGPLIRNHTGFIDKYIGDSIMALFPHNASDAVDAAVDMRGRLVEFNDERSLHRLAPISIGIGINTGNLILGTIGDAERLEGTVVADAVNLASRLEGLTKLYGAGIIISEHTLKKLKDISKYSYRMLDRVQVVGKKESVTVFEIFDGEPDHIIRLKLETKPVFEEGVNYYHRGEFQEASRRFRDVLAMNGEDKASSLHIKRCDYFTEHGVPPEWIGVSIINTK